MTKVIDMNKKYKTRSGLPVRVLCTDVKSRYPVAALVTEKDGNELLLTFSTWGCFTAGAGETVYDLIEVSPYEDFKVDDLCVVSDAAGAVFRYFTKEVNGTAFCFNEGKTSFTCKAENIMSWDTCRKATPEEIATKTIKS